MIKHFIVRSGIGFTLEKCETLKEGTNYLRVTAVKLVRMGLEVHRPNWRTLICIKKDGSHLKIKLYTVKNEVEEYQLINRTGIYSRL